ncbi:MULTISPECIES: YhcB family protein [Eikenella]|uniref:Z-ring associated protein G n=1 Tax=Eikenella longinqua TaxID=1795827 RepID=A0A1A9S2Q9_9NEIS|nr:MULTISPECIES: DUF1043 family protein [Eikenella]OAM31048.1 hypothetical protein A7P95_00645 [Eikenella longinqua]
MNNLPLITQLLLAGLGGFLIGVLITLLLKRGNRKQQAELEEAKKALQDYREAVNHHFIDTADAVDELTRSYQNVFAQLSRGAEELMTPEAYRSQIEQRSGQTITLSYLADAEAPDAADAPEQRIQLVPYNAPVPQQNDLDEADAAADAPVFNPAPNTASVELAAQPAEAPAADSAPAAEPAAETAAEAESTAEEEPAPKA